MAAENPVGFDGLGFIEFGAIRCSQVVPILQALGFRATVMQDGFWVLHQGGIQAVVNARPGSWARNHAELHGPNLSGLGLRVRSPQLAWNRALDCGAHPLISTVDQTWPELYSHAVSGIGGVGFYFLESTQRQVAAEPGRGLTGVDHITFNVMPGNRIYWNNFLNCAFGFRNVFEADLVVDGTRSRTTVMQSPCNGVSLACNEPLDFGSPLHRQLHDLNGEGLQHLAFSTDDIVALADYLETTTLKALPVPADHYESAGPRAANLGLDIDLLRQLNILIDSHDAAQSSGMLQRFTTPVLGPSFLEFVQRINFDQGFVQRTAQTLLKTIANRSQGHR